MTLTRSKRKAAGGSADQPADKRHAAEAQTADSAAAAAAPDSLTTPEQGINTARIQAADSLEQRAAQGEQRLRADVVLANLLRQAIKMGATAGESMRKAMQMLTDDSRRDEPLINLSHGLATGQSLLTLLICTMDKCSAFPDDSREVMYTKQTTSYYLHKHVDLLCSLIARTPPADERHPDEAGALAQLSHLVSLMTPNSPDSTPPGKVAAALISRGCGLEVRSAAGLTPLQEWARGRNMTNGCAIIWLLEQGADIDAPQQNGHTVLYSLCNSSQSAQPLSDLLDAGWLARADLTLPGVNGETPLAYLRRVSMGPYNAGAAVEKLEILHGAQQQWHQFTRPAISAQLQVHEQLVPDIADIILSYVDGGQPDKSAASSSSSA